MNGYFDGPDEVGGWRPQGMRVLSEGLIGPLNLLMGTGYHFVPNAITGSTLESMTRIARGLTFTAGKRNLNGVEQTFDECRINLNHSVREIMPFWALALDLGISAGESDIEGLPGWRPRELTVQRYPAANVGIGPHRDFSRDVLLVAVLNLVGTATFNILEDDRVTSRDHWICEPGDLILLAGAGLGSKYDRPVHSVTNVRGERISLAYRMVAS